jgi:hypothetical protein
MQAITAFRVATLTLALSSVPAFAFTPASNSAVSSRSPIIAKADFVQGHEVLAGIPARSFARAEASKDMAQRYFDVDVIVTLGALAIASGAFVAAGMAGGRRRVANAPRTALPEGWRQNVMQAVEADLMQFTAGMRNAA